MNRKYLNLILLTILAFILFFSPLVTNFGKTGKKIDVLGKNYSYLSKNEIISRLNSDFPLPQDIELKHDDLKIIINTANISATIDKNQMVSTLLFRRLNQGLYRYISAFFRPKTFELIYLLDQEKLNEQINQIALRINRPFIPSEFTIDKYKKVHPKIGEIGQQVDIEYFELEILNALNNYKMATPINIPVDTLGSLPTKEQIDTATTNAQQIIGRSITLVGSDQKIIINDELLISWYDFDGTYKISKITEYIANLATSLKKDPIDAVFQFENGKVLAFQPAKKGYSLDSPQLLSLLNRHLPSLINNPEKNINIDLPLIFTDPKIDTSQVNNLGIKELIGKGTSSFKTSASYRNVNVARGAAIVNRILVAPNEKFSFTRALGQVITENGFGKAYIIKEGRTVLDVGGGICQVSTTFFRAILNAGLNITERHAHAYRVGYYEEDMPPGYDATVFSPKPDLQFINDTGNNILIQSVYDGVNKVLTYEIYGTSDGRQVEITNYRKWGSVPPPPPIYNDDPTLPSGKVIQDEHAVGGLRTAFDWKVTRDGQVLHQQTFSSAFRAWPAVYRRGTGQ
jgi:vancomycin resistance protein YoaR